MSRQSKHREQPARQTVAGREPPRHGRRFLPGELRAILVVRKRGLLGKLEHLIRELGLVAVSASNAASVRGLLEQSSRSRRLCL